MYSKKLCSGICSSIFSALALTLILGGSPVNSAEYSQDLDVQVRLDKRSQRSLREQYRIRFYPSLAFNKAWSMHGFMVTGDDFASSHNTFGGASTDYLYMRRLYARYKQDDMRAEFGVIPTYKGKVSSSGLSKDGYIKGGRLVFEKFQEGQLEFVVGELENTSPKTALNTPKKANYFELEYSGSLSDLVSFELSAERMTQSNFIRGEIRHQTFATVESFFELVSRVDSSKTKAVLGLDGEIVIGNYPLSFFTHYSYVSDNFGLRAELTEDFLGTGHGFSIDVSSSVPHTQLDWFARVDAVDANKRFLIGLKWSL